MPISQPTFKPGQIQISGASSASITNLAMAVSGTEYSHSLQTGLKQLTIKARNNSEIKISFTSGQSGTLYMTIPKFSCLFLNDLSFSGTIIYAQASSNNEVLEILELY